MTNNKTTLNNTVAVLGAGIIGINCALELQSLGFNVTLIDKSGIGEGCSKNNAGHFATEQVFPLAEAHLLWKIPKFLLDPLGPMALSPSYFPKALPWFLRFMGNMFSHARTKNTRALQALNKHAIDYYKPLLRSANAQHLLTEQGSLLVFESANAREAQQLFEHYQNANITVELLNRDAVFALEPNLSKNINYALYFKDVAHTANPFEICQVLAEQAFKLGTKFEQKLVKDIKQLPAGIQLVTNDEHGTHEAFYDQVVVATGAWSKHLLSELNYTLPIEAERGYSYDLHQNSAPLLSRPVASVERKFIMTPMAHGLRFSGTVEFAGINKPANMARANALYQNAQYLLDDLPTTTNGEPQRWLGFRPSLPDSLPVIGKAPKHKHIYLALGHQHLGLTLGAITGKLIGQLMTDKKTDIDVRPYCISRFN